MPVIITQDDYKGDPKAEEIFGSKTTDLAVWGLKEANTGAIIGRMVARWDEIKDIEVNGFEWVRRADFLLRRCADMPNITKKTCEEYTIRNGGEYGTICLSISGSTVNVLCNTSFGSYCYWWGACGESPKKFLTQISMSYTMDKFTGGKLMVPDPDKFAEEIKRLIIEARRENDLSCEEARSAWGDLLSVLDYHPSGDAMYAALVESEWFEKVFGDYENLPNSKTIDPQCQGFWDKIWTPFVDYLKSEIAQ